MFVASATSGGAASVGVQLRCECRSVGAVSVAIAMSKSAVLQEQLSVECSSVVVQLGASAVLVGARAVFVVSAISVRAVSVSAAAV